MEMKTRPAERPFVILMVEDNAADVFMVREALDELGFRYELRTASEGRAALKLLLELVEGGNTLPDLIVLDLNLPGMNGRQFLKVMEDTPQLGHLPVAVFSTSASESEVGRGYPRLRTTFATKTPNPRELMDIIGRFKAFAEAMA